VCFYRRIEDFRKIIRKYANLAAAAAAAAASKSQQAHGLASGNVSKEQAQVRDCLHKACQKFSRFLTEATEFYTGLLRRFDERLQSKRTAPVEEGSRRRKVDASTEAVIASVTRCLIFLGDISRYRELHSESSHKDWSKAEAFYVRALAVQPYNGNPHNQLAVLATYTDAEAVALYRYCRSLMVGKPFLTARENLALLFEKNRQKKPEDTLNLQEQPEQYSQQLAAGGTGISGGVTSSGGGSWTK
jgi:hypothetical protein